MPGEGVVIGMGVDGIAPFSPRLGGCALLLLGPGALSGAAFCAARAFALALRDIFLGMADEEDAFAECS